MKSRTCCLGIIALSVTFTASANSPSICPSVNITCPPAKETGPSLQTNSRCCLMPPDVANVLKGVSDTASLAINAEKQQAENTEKLATKVKDFYETVTIAGAAIVSVITVILGWLGYTDRKETKGLKEEAEKTLRRTEDAETKATELQTALQEKLEDAEKELAGLKNRAAALERDAFWAPLVPRIVTYFAFAEREDQPANRQAYLQRTAALLSELVAKDKLGVLILGLCQFGIHPEASWGCRKGLAKCRGVARIGSATGNPL